MEILGCSLSQTSDTPPLLDISPTQLCRASSSFPAALFTPCLAMVLARPFGRAPFPTKLPRTLPPTLGRTLPRTLARTPPCAGVSVGVESDSVAVAEAFWSWGPARDIYVHIERERERERQIHGINITMSRIHPNPTWFWFDNVQLPKNSLLPIKCVLPLACQAMTFLVHVIAAIALSIKKLFP